MTLSRILPVLALSILSVTASGEPTSESSPKGYYPGMLISQNNYVRLKNCSQESSYALLPAGKYGYEAMAELISVRKNYPVTTPISVGLQGEVEYDAANNSTGNFLVRGIEFVKTGESCDLATQPVEEVAKAPQESKDQSAPATTSNQNSEKKPLAINIPTKQTDESSPAVPTKQENTVIESTIQNATIQNQAKTDQYGITEEVISTRRYQK